MRYFSPFLVASIVVGGCTPAGNALPNSSWAAPHIQLLGKAGDARELTSSTPVGFSGAVPIVPLAQLRRVPTNQGTLDLVLWGTRNVKNGAIGTVTEAQVLGIGGSHDDVHVFFDEQMRPIFLRDDASLYGVAVDYETPLQRRFTFCSSAFEALAQTTLTKTSSGWHAGPATGGGTCVASRARSSRARPRPASSCADPKSFKCRLYVIGLLLLAAGAHVGYYVALAPLIAFLASRLDPRIPHAAAAIDVAATILAIPAVYRFKGNARKVPSAVPGIDGARPQYETPP